MLFAFSESENVDPAEGSIRLYQHPMRLALYGEKGQQMWEHTLSMGLIPGTWLMPFIAFDLDGDGVDEIWNLNNISEVAPFNARTYVLERRDTYTGKVTLQIPFHAENTEWERLGHAFRFMLFAGYVKGEPVLVTNQGTYHDIFLQCYNADMSVRWNRKIEMSDGSRGSHSSPVFDINQDGIDEVLFGEHVISLDTGEDIFCCDRERYHGHSDVVLPFRDHRTGKGYIYTCRESGDYDGCPRIVMYDQEGNLLWQDVYSDEWGDYIDDGHMHYGFVATVRPDYRRVAFARRQREKKKQSEELLYDAVTGEQISIPFSMSRLRPIDINGDGYHEYLYWEEGTPTTRVIDAEGEDVYQTGGVLIQIGKWYGYPGEQFMVWYPAEGVVRIWGDTEACDSEELLKRHAGGFHKFMNKMTGSGYNWLTSVDCSG